MSMMIRRGLARAAEKQAKVAPKADAPKQETASSGMVNGAAQMQKRRQNPKGKRG